MTWSKVAWVGAVWLVSGLLGGPARGDMRLAAAGRSRVTVTLTPSSGPLVRAAAADLARCMGVALGARVQVRETTQPVDTPLTIVVGRRIGASTTGLQRDGCAIQTVGNRLLLSGATDTGVANAVYTFLTDHVGVRWFAPGPLYEVIPARPGMRLPNVRLRWNPSFRYRLMPGPPGDAGTDWQRRNRLDVGTEGIARSNFGHSTYAIIPPSRYGKDHPEYFAMIDGRRKVPSRDDGGSTNPCFTHPDVIRITAEAAHRYFAENPNSDTFSVSINDSADHCQCPKCAALDAGLPPGQGGVKAFSGSYFHYVREVAKRVATTDPGKFIGCFPYWPVYPLPPSLDRLPDNVALILTQDSSQQHNAAYRAQERAHWLQWRRKTRSMARYDYYELGWLTPRTYPHIAADDLRFLHANRCDGFYCAVAPAWCILGPHMYVSTRMLWDVRLDEDALLREYCATLFGPARQEMQRFYADLERYWLKPRPARWFEGLAGMTSEFPAIDGPLIERAWSRLARAEAIATGKALERVRDAKSHFRLPYLLVKVQAQARSLAARRPSTRADLNLLAKDILGALALLPEAADTYAKVWQPDPNYNGSYYTPDAMRVRLRDWGHEARKWLTIASRNAEQCARALPSGESEAAWTAFRGALLARNADLETQGLVRDYRADFDRSDQAINGGKGLSESDNAKGALAWNEAYVLSAYVEMYEATRDQDYLRRLVAHFDRVLKTRDDVVGRPDAYAGKPLAGWGSTPYSAGKWHVWIVHTGMITMGPAAFVRLVSTTPGLQAEFGAKAAEYRTRIEECIRDAEPYWHNGPEPDEGYYVGAHLGAVLPLNQQNALGFTLLDMYIATRNPAYRDKVVRLARFFHRRLRYPVSDYYDWAYWPRESVDGPGSEDISHAGLNVEFAARCAQEGIAFTRPDAVRIARTWLQVVRRSDGTWADTVGGEGKGNTYMPYSVGHWVTLCPLLPDHMATKLYQDAVRAYPDERKYGAGDMLSIARLLRYGPRASQAVPDR